VGDSLADSLAADLRCDPSIAVQLAAKARHYLPEILGTVDDHDEDLILRLRDPRVCGELAAALLEDNQVSGKARILLAEHTFDLLPLPRGEADVILVETRAPRSLLPLAAFLTETNGLTVLHVMHLLFAVFLDRDIVRGAARTVRSKVLYAVVRLTETDADHRSLYAALHLSAVPEPEAHGAFRAILSGDVDESVKELIARASAADDGGFTILLKTAQAVGLVPSDWTDAGRPEALANIPRLPPRLRALGRRWLNRSL
jgi:hypothetical protein